MLFVHFFFVMLFDKLHATVIGTYRAMLSKIALFLNYTVRVNKLCLKSGSLMTQNW